MPMINSKSQVMGLIQVGNSEKQLQFSEHDLDIVRLIAFKVANFITDARENMQTKTLFQKQMELSVLNTNLESQSLNKIMTLANQLFQKNHKQPLNAVGYFVKKTEKYLRQTFNCIYSQMLLVDNEKSLIFSFDVKDKHARLIKRGEAFADYSITNALIKGNFQEPIVWPGTQEQNSNIHIEDDSQNQVGKMPQSHQNFYAQFINLYIDCPLVYPGSDMPQTYLSMTIRDNNDPTKVLGVIQLLSRSSNIRFTEQDVQHLSTICLQLSQVLSHIFNEGLLSLMSEDQTAKLQAMFRIFAQKHKNHMKHFVRELLLFKYGKVNLLKNKIMRKYMDRHMQVDQKLIKRVEKLAEIREKCSLSRKQEAMQILKAKVKALNDKRHSNALKCLQVVTKYEKLLGIRVKDTVFRFWERLRNEGITLTNQSNIIQDYNHDGGIISPTFNGGCGSVIIHDNSVSLSSISNIQNNSSILEESSITSVIYSRAKSIYKLRKIFNKNKLKRHFDAFMIKLYHHNFKNDLFNLEGRRLMKIHSILSKSVHKLNVKVFTAFYKNYQTKSNQQKTLFKVASRRGLKDLSFGMKHWQNFTEKSIKNEMKQDKTFISQLAEQCRDTNILSTLMTGLNQIFGQFHFQSVEECIQSSSIKLFFNNLAEQLVEGISNKHPGQHQIVFTFKLPENYCISEGSLQQYCMFVYPDGSDRLTLQSSIEVRQNTVKETIEFNQFTSISDINVVQASGPDMISIQQNQAFITIIDGSQDCILKQLSQTMTSLSYQKQGQVDEHTANQMNQALRLRHAQDYQSALLIPMIDHLQSTISSQSSSFPQTHIFGTLEVYSSKVSQNKYNTQSISIEDQNRLKQQAQVIQIGLESLSQRLSFIHQVSMMTMKQNGQDNIRRNSTLSSDQVQNRSLSGIVQQLTNRIQSLLQADHCLLVFIPSESSNQGLFYNFTSCQLYSLDLSQTLFADLLMHHSQDYNNAITSLTFPLSLSEITTEHTSYESVTCERSYQALKYLLIDNETTKVYVEIGWNKKHQAQQIHDNQYAIERLESKVRNMVNQEVSKVTKDLKSFTRVIGRKVKELMRDTYIRSCFARWKQLSYIPQLNYAARQNQESYTGFVVGSGQISRGHLNMGESSVKKSHSRYSSLGYQNNESDRSPQLQRYKVPYAGRSSISPVTRGNKSQPRVSQTITNSRPYYENRRSSHHRSVSMDSQQQYCHRSSQKSVNSQLSNNPDDLEMINLPSEIEVEKAAKRKLVSAALVMIGVQCRLLRKVQLKHAMSEWKTFQHGTQIAEGAFNKLLELNHRHSKVRFETAAKNLNKVFKLSHSRRFFCLLIETLSARNRPTPEQRAQQIQMSSPRNVVMDSTNDFEEEVLRELADVSNVRKQRQHFGSLAKQSIMQLQGFKEEDLESEFSLGTGGNGTKVLQMLSKARNESVGQGTENRNQYVSQERIKPQGIQSNNLYQNMFKRI